METCFNYVDKDRAFFSSDERRYINKVRNLQKKYPDKVRIIREPEDNDGCIYCELPVEWFTVRVPKQMNYTDEQRRQIAERLARSSVHHVSNEKWHHLPLSHAEDEYLSIH